MGDLQAWVGDDNRPSSPSSPSQTNPDPAAIASGTWQLAEEATRKIIRQIQPTKISEEQRHGVVDFVQRIIRGYLGSEVFPFGSVPLKTYLPDGDIDLTAIGVLNKEDALAVDVSNVLKKEETNTDSEFEVRDVQLINAEVKLVKCLVQNIVVDISFNQIGGLCTLSFLEQVDRRIGKGNLFKRSIILIKAWCYYESRILGAHHGLISTYALETLILYIFHLFHASLDGPLAVLYRFLDYYSKFDWDNYGISLQGPMLLSSLPDLVAEPPDTEGDLLLSTEFLKNSVQIYAVPSRGLENNSRVFGPKFFNIVDPLRENNNLGRSIGRGNFCRIRSAFAYGARKLGRLLLLPNEFIAEEISNFFLNTLERHGSGERPDVQGCLPRILGNQENDRNHNDRLKDKEDYSIPASANVGCEQELYEYIDKVKISVVDIELDHSQKSRSPSSSNSVASGVQNWKVECDGPSETDIFAGRRLAGDAEDLASSQTVGSKDVNGIAVISPPSEAGSYKELSSCSSSWLSHANVKDKVTSDLSGCTSQNTCVADSSSVRSDENLNRENCEPLDLLDLTGDYETNFQNLLFAQWCHDCMQSAFFLPNQRSPPSQFRNKYHWDVFQRQSMFMHMNCNGVVPGPPFHPGLFSMHPSMMPGPYATEDIPKSRGTGTYLPNVSPRAHKEKHSPGRGRAQLPANHIPRPRNSRPLTLPDVNFGDRVRSEPPSQSHPSHTVNGRGRPAMLDITQPSHPPKSPHANGFVHPIESSRLEFGSLNAVPVPVSSPEPSWRSFSAGHNVMVPAASLERQETTSNSERIKQSYQLKDDDDFPPLSV